MTFAWPDLLWLLFLPAIWLVWEITHRRRSVALTRPKILRAEAASRSLVLRPVAAGPVARSRPRWWLTLGVALCIVALARPQWGHIEEPVFDQAREILIAVDLSRSMLTPDVKPSRLERAKLLIQSLLEKLEGERVGMVVFSGTAFLQSPLSADYEILREFLPNLNPDFLPEGGTNYRALIDTAVSAFASTSTADRFLIVLSDGEATDDDWKSRVDELKKKGVRTISLGIGTSAGAMIPDGTGGFVKDDRGAVVLSKLESNTLQELAAATNGVYRDASSWVDLAALLKQTVETGQKGKFVEKNTERFVERFQWPLALGLWCLLASLCYEFPVRPKPREIALDTGSRKPGKTGDRIPETGKLKPQAAKAAATVAVLIFLSGIRYPVSGFAANPTPTPIAASPTPTTSATLPTPPPEPPPLAKLVGRLANAGARDAHDWADLARETVTWGHKLQSEQQPVPEGPVRDALTAVEIGAKENSDASDWSKIREELQELLKKPEQKKNQQQKDQNKPQQQNDDQKKSDQQEKQEAKSSPQEQKSQESKPSDPSQNSDPQKSPDKESQAGKPKEEDEPPPPPEPGETQKVGGAPEKRQDSAAAEASLAQPLQKLEQLRADDSPAKLFQMMEGERKPSTAKKGKDW